MNKQSLDCIFNKINKNLKKNDTLFEEYLKLKLNSLILIKKELTNHSSLLNKRINISESKDIEKQINRIKYELEHVK